MRLTEDEYRQLKMRMEGTEDLPEPVSRLRGPKGPNNLENAVESLLSILGAPEFVREHRGIPGRKFRFDFAWPDAKVALEINGGIYQVKSGHRSVQGLERDYEKANLAQLHGWTYFQVSPKMASNADTMEQIISFVKEKGNG